MEVVGALINAVFLLAMTLSIIMEAVTRFVEPPDTTKLEENAGKVFTVGCIGLGVNILGLFLFGHGHDHGHDHSHDHDSQTVEPNEAIELNNLNNMEEHDHGAHEHKGNNHDGHDHGNMNIRGVFLHVLGDALGSVAVIIAAGLIKWSDWKDATITDPIASLVISAIITYTTIPLLKQSTHVLLQQSPHKIDGRSMISTIFDRIPDLVEIHEFHIWQLTPKQIVCTLHAVQSAESSGTCIASEVSTILHEFGVHSSTVQSERASKRALKSIAEGKRASLCILKNSCKNNCNESKCCDKWFGSFTRSSLADKTVYQRRSDKL